MSVALTPPRLFAAGIAYVVAYAAATALLAPPANAGLRAALAMGSLLVPTLLAFGLTAHASLGSRGAERAFWALLSAAALAHAVNQALYLSYMLSSKSPVVLLAAHSLYYGHFVLLWVALLVRPDRPQPAPESGAAALEWTMALVGGYFLVVYFALLPGREPRHPWFLLFTVNDVVPALWALALARSAREQPFRGVYGWLAAGFLGGALADAPANWAAIHGGHRFLGPLDVAIMLPFVAMASAALCPRGTSWMRPAPSGDAGRSRARVAALAVAVPPSLDLAMRAFGVQPQLANARSLLTLFAAAALSLLAALRARQSSRLGAPPTEASGPSTGEPSEFLRFASGAAHELNNPLMAVAGWAELALRRGGESEPLRALLASTRATADAVERLQRLARSGRAEGGARS